MFIPSDMSIHHLHRQQQLKADIDTVWAFFSNPRNLAKITPEYMNFRVTSPPYEGEIYPGQIITYKVSPVAGIPMSWMTEITHVQPKTLFVDEQRHGPYRIWHHEHKFETNEQGVLITDLVHYQLPMLFVGDIAHSLFVKKQLNNIFAYRQKVISDIFC